ncbi:hypothetical protein K3R12_004625 [Escherichia coli]|nr:hypothetical protein [Escherichia coli]
MLGGADNPNGELPSYITGADNLDIGRPPAFRKDVQHWLVVNRRFSGRG